MFTQVLTCVEKETEGDPSVLKRQRFRMFPTWEEERVGGPNVSLSLSGVLLVPRLKRIKKIKTSLDLLFHVLQLFTRSRDLGA